jgi:hypothetical protein
MFLMMFHRRNPELSLFLSAVFLGCCFGLCPAEVFGDIPEPDTTYLIVSKFQDQALQVEDAARENLANIEVGPVHGGANQGWRFVPERIQGQPHPVFAIFSLKSGKVLDVSGYSKADGANVQQFKYFGSNNQRWKLIPAEEGFFRIVSAHSGKCLEVMEPPQQYGVNVHQNECRDTDYQRWRVQLYPHADTACRIVSENSGMALDVSRLSLDSGANVKQYRIHGGDNQWWTLSPVGEQNGHSIYRIISLHSGKALDVENAGLEDRANVQQFRYHGGANQHWKMAPTAEGCLQIVSLHSGKCLDVAGESRLDGANVQQFSCKNEPHQCWRLVEKSIID